MRKILIIGIGVGNPDYLTVQAIEALNQADVFFIPGKGTEKAALRDLRTKICERFITNRTYRTVDVAIPVRAESSEGYKASVEDWHAKIEASYEQLFRAEIPESGCGALLVWGDPMLYDSTLRIIERIHAKGFPFEYDVIPGITAVQALAARHKIALNRIGEPVLITTGRKITVGWPADIPDAVVMLDGDQAFNRLDPEGIDIFWGAYLGSEDEILISGRLADVRDEIASVRQKARDAHGWIMDTYLLRKTGEA